MLVISDTGGGMDDKTKAHLFEPFFTTKLKGKGKGLGLSTVYGIVKQSGGVISVKSEAGHGTSARIYLPRVDEPVKSDRSDVLLAGATVDSETILVAEDDPGVRSLVCITLRLRGYVVLEAQDGVEALMIGGQHQGPLHLLLTDVAMPQMNGREVAERLAAQRPDFKVLFMSGYSDDALLRRGLMAPGVSFIQKPFSSDALAKTVRKHANVLQHILGYFKERLGAHEKAELLGVIGDYHHGLTPLIVLRRIPRSLLRGASLSL